MLDKLKGFFRVKELQDVRTLFTDSPIAFAEEYPHIPKPESALSPQMIAARWILHDLYGEDMPGIAADLLEAGFDSPALRRLSAETRVERSGDVEGLVAAVLREMDAPYPLSENDAKLILSRQIAREVITGQRNAWAAASHLVISIWGWNCDRLEVGTISELLDQLDWDSFNTNQLPQITSELIEAFAGLAAQTDREKRLAALGSLEGKGWIADDFDDPLPDDLLAEFEGRDGSPEK